jgi:hypothetical protein
MPPVIPARIFSVELAPVRSAGQAVETCFRRHGLADEFRWLLALLFSLWLL